MYHIKQVDHTDEDVAEDLCFMDECCFIKGLDAALELSPLSCWWIVYDDAGKPVGYAGVCPSHQWQGYGYLCRAGVMPTARGHGLQKRLLRVRERYAKRIGWHGLLTDTTDNVYSANNLAKAGYGMYEPTSPWGMAHTLYWRKLWTAT